MEKQTRKEEIKKGCGTSDTVDYEDDYTYCGDDPKEDGNVLLCKSCQARLDERIRAEQDFLKMIDEFDYSDKDFIEELKAKLQEQKA
jgi:hypothetical protein